MTGRRLSPERFARYAPGLVIAFSALLAVSRWIRYSPTYFNNCWEYILAGSAILQGNYFALDSGFRTPLFPLYLAFTGNKPRVMFVGHLLIGIVVSVLLYQIFNLITGRPAIGVAVAVLYNLNPSTVFFQTTIMAETLTTLFVTLGAFFAVRTCYRRSAMVRELFLSSLAFCLASLTRPEYQLLPLVITAAVIILAARAEPQRWVRRETLRAAAAGLLPFLILIGGWAEVNYARFHWFTLSTLEGYNLTQYSWPYLAEAPPEYKGMTDIFRRYQNIRLREKGWPYGTWFDARPEMLKATGMTDAEISRALTGISLRIIARHPGSYLKVVVRAFQVFWRPPIYSRGCNLGDLRQGLRAVLAGRATWWDRLYAYLYLPFEYAYALALAGPLIRRRWRPLLWSPGVLMLNIMIFYVAGITSLLNPEDNNRYKFPVESLILGVIVIFIYLVFKDVVASNERVSA